MSRPRPTRAGRRREDRVRQPRCPRSIKARGVRQAPRRGLDRVPRLEQDRRGVPGAADELMVVAVGDLHRDGAVAEAHRAALDVDDDRLPGIAPNGPLQPQDVVHRGGQARNPQRDAVAEEDFRERTADDGLDSPSLERFGGVLARGPAAEVEADDEHGGALVDLLVERVLGVLLARVLEGVLPEALERHRLQEPRGDDAVGVDVVAEQGNPAPRDLESSWMRAHFTISRTSATAPVIAAAATIAGLISSVRPWGLPWRPMKLRLLEEAETSRPRSLSSFMPRHIEQPALRHSNPAARKTSCNPSRS